MSNLNWVPDGEDGWRWELFQAGDDYYEGKVLRLSVTFQAWHVRTNTVEDFCTMREAAQWLVSKVTP